MLVLVGRGDATGTRAMGRASLPGDPAAGPPFSRTGMRCTTERYGAAGAPLGPRAPAGQGIPIIPKNSVLHPVHVRTGLCPLACVSSWCARPRECAVAFKVFMMLRSSSLLALEM